jgi:molybdate transport system regulatory protein
MDERVLRLRLVLRPGAVLGPGKIDLLEAIAETGSIRAAGGRFQMSYRRAWELVAELNGMFSAPLVIAEAGGRGGGGATLTPLGFSVVKTLPGHRGEGRLCGRFRVPQSSSRSQGHECRLAHGPTHLETREQDGNDRRHARRIARPPHGAVVAPSPRGNFAFQLIACAELHQGRFKTPARYDVKRSAPASNALT